MEENYLDGLVIPERKDIYLADLLPRIYNVKSGDSLYNIANGDLGFAKSIAYANDLQNPNFIKTGLELIIPYPNQFAGDQGYDDYITNVYNPAMNSFRRKQSEKPNVSSVVNYGNDNKKPVGAPVDYGTYDGMKLDKSGFVLGMYKPEQWDLLTDRRKVQILSLYGDSSKTQSPIDMEDRDIGFTSYMAGDDYEQEEIVSAAKNLVNNSIKTDNSFDIPTYGIGDYMKKMSNESKDTQYKRLYGDEYLNQLDFADNQTYDFIHSATDEDLRHYQDNVANKDVLRAINIEMNKRDYNPNGLDNKQKLYKDMFGFGDDVAFTYGNDGSVIVIDGDNHVVNLNKDPKTAFKEIASNMMKSENVRDEIVLNTMEMIDETNDIDKYNLIVGLNLSLNNSLQENGYSNSDTRNIVKICDIILNIQDRKYRSYNDADSDMHFLGNFGDTGRELQKYIVESIPKERIESELLGKIPFVVDPSTERYSKDALRLSNKYLGDDYTKDIFDNRLNSTLNAVGTSMFDVGMIMYDLMSLDAAVNMVLNTINSTGSKLLQNKTLNLMNEAFKSARLWKNSGFLRQAAFGTVDSAILYNVVRDALEFSNREFNDSRITEDELDKMSAIISMGVGSVHNIRSVHDARKVFLNLKTKQGFDKVELFFFGSKRNFNELLSDKITNYIGGLNMTEMIMLETGGIAPELWSYAKNDKGFYEYLKEDKQMSDIGASIMSLLAGAGSVSAGKALVRGSGSVLKGSAMKLFEISGGTDKGVEEFKYNAKNIEPSFRKTIGIKHIGLNGSVDSEDLLGWNSNGKINLDFVPKQKWNETENKNLRSIIFDKARELFPNMSDDEINDRITKTINDINSRIPKAQRKARLGWFLGRNSYSQIFIDNEKTFTQSNKYANGIKGLKLTDIIYGGLDVDERFGKTIESVIINSDGKRFASTKWGKFLESLPILKYHPERLYNGRSAKIVFLGNPKVLDYDYKYVLLDGREVDLFVKGEINPLIEITELRNKKNSGNSILGRVVTNDGQTKTVLNNIRGHWDVPIVHYDSNGNREELQLMIDVSGVGSGASSSGSKLSKRTKLIILNETPNQQIVTMSINKKSGSKYNLWEDAAVLFRDSDVELEIPKQFDDIIEINKEIDPIYKFILSDRNGAKNVKLSLDGEKFKFSN